MSGFTAGKCKKAGAFSLVLLKTPASIHGLFDLFFRSDRTFQHGVPLPDPRRQGLHVLLKLYYLLFPEIGERLIQLPRPLTASVELVQLALLKE